MLILKSVNWSRLDRGNNPIRICK